MVTLISGLLVSALDYSRSQNSSDSDLSLAGGQKTGVDASNLGVGFNILTSGDTCLPPKKQGLVVTGTCECPTTGEDCDCQARCQPGFTGFLPFTGLEDANRVLKGDRSISLKCGQGIQDSPVSSGKTSKVAERLLAKDAIKVDRESKDKQTALKLATSRCYLEAVRRVLLRLINQREDDKTVLMVAVDAQHHEVITELATCQGVEIDINAFREDGSTALMQAASLGYKEEIKALNGIRDIDCNRQRKDGWTALMLAAFHNRFKVLDELHNCTGIRIDAKTFKDDAAHQGEKTALMLAAQRGNNKVVDVLTTWPGIGVDATSQDGSTALMVAVSCQAAGAPAVVGTLCEKKAKANMRRKDDLTALMIAAVENRFEILENLEKCTDIDANAKTSKEKGGKTALILAVEKGNSEVVKHLVNFPGVDVGETSVDGTTALMAAMVAEVPLEGEVIELLCSKADPNVFRHKDDLTALMIAVLENRLEALEKLKKCEEVNPDAKSPKEKGGKTALRLAVERGNNEAVKSLVEFPRINVGEESLDGTTALMAAMTAVAPLKGDVIELLCSKADPNVLRRTDSLTAFMIAVTENRLEALEKLKTCDRLNPDAKTTKEKGGKTALMLAVEQGNDQAVDLLSNFPSLDINQKCSDGRTALIIAAQQGKSKAVQILAGNPKIDLNAALEDGSTALMAAIDRTSIQVEDLESVIHTLCANIETDLNLARQDGLTALMIAARKNRVEVLVQLKTWEDRIDVNAQTPIAEGALTALMLAAKQGYDEAVRKLLLFKNIDSEILNHDHETAYFMAADNCFRGVLRALDQSNANSTTKNKAGLTPVAVAAQKGCSKVVTYLLVDTEQPDKDLNAMVTLAAERGEVEVLDTVYSAWQPKEGEGNPRFVKALLEVDEDGNSGLALAVRNNQTRALRFLMTRVKAEDYTGTLNNAGESLFFLAAKHNMLHIAQMLQDSGNPMQSDKAGNNALMAAVSGGHREMSNYIADQKLFEATAINKAGWTVLHHAIESERPIAMVDWIFDHVPKPEARGLLDALTFAEVQEVAEVDGTISDRKESKGGLTALLMAIEKGNIGLVENLLKRRPDRHKGLMSALRLALKHGHYFIVTMLLAKGASMDNPADIDPEDWEGRRLAAWFQVQYSMVDSLKSFSHNPSTWGNLSSQPENCTGDMQGLCEDGMMTYASSAGVVHELLDWQDGFSLDDHPDHHDDEIVGSDPKAVCDGLKAAFFSPQAADAALAFLSRGAWDDVKETNHSLLFENLSAIILEAKESETNVTMEEAKWWNPLHWAAFSCDVNALSLALKLPSHKLVSLLDSRPAEGRSLTPYEIAEQNRCVRSWAVIQVLQFAWIRQFIFRLIGATLTVTFCFGGLFLHVFFIQFQTLKKRGCMLMSVVPLPFVITAIVMVACDPEWVDGSIKITRAYLQSVIGWVATVTGAVLLLTIWAAFASPAVTTHLVALKKMATDKRDRFWDKAYCSLAWSMAIVLFVEAGLILQMDLGCHIVALILGLCHACTATLPFYISKPKRFLLLTRFLSVAFVLGVLIVDAVSGNPVSSITSEALIVFMTTVSLAMGDVVGAVKKAAKTVAARGELELRSLRTVEARRVTINRFSAGHLVLGQAASAAQGIDYALGLDPQDIVEGLTDPIETMRREILATEDPNDLENFDYIVNGVSNRKMDLPTAVAKSLEAGVYHGGSIGPHDFDTGHDGRTLDDWMELPQVRLAKLTKGEFIAVRFYTSSSFPKINGPLRKEIRPHPWAMTVYLIDRGVKKLRSVQAQVDPEAFARETTLWRGMKNLEVDIDRFAAVGGTEMAPMSTTTNEDVARHYATSKVPLVFKFVVGGLKTGVSIQFLSLYPKEEEFLYAPLTFLSLKNHYEDDGTTILVVEPVMS